MILIMASDYEKLREELPDCMKIENENVKGTIIYKTKIEDSDVLFVNSGITKVDFTRNFANVIGKYPITKVIGIGNAASLNKNVKIGEVAICDNSLQYDVDFTPLGYKISEIPEINKSIFYSNKELINLAIKASKEVCIEYDVGRTISADKFIANCKQAFSLKQCFEADVLDTECGILGELSYLYYIPTVTIKGISNYADNCAVEEYEKNRNMANKKSLKVALVMIGILNENKCEDNYKKDKMSCNGNLSDYHTLNLKEILDIIKF